MGSRVNSILWLASTVVAFSAPLLAAADPYTITCGDSDWQGTAGMNSVGDRFTGTMVGSCDIVLNASGNIAILKAGFQKSLETTYKLISGPTTEQFDNLPSVAYELTSNTDDKGSKLTVHTQLHVASDLTNRFEAVFTSIDISGTGDDQYLRVLNQKFDISQDKTDPKTYHITESQYIEVEKPGYLAGFMFAPIAKSRSLSQFKEVQKTEIAIYAEGLLDTPSSTHR